MAKWICTLCAWLIIFTVSYPGVSYGANYSAEDQLKEAENYVSASNSLFEIASNAMKTYDKNQAVTADNRKERYETYAYSIVPAYKKFYQGLMAMKDPENLLLFIIHRNAAVAAYQQMQALTQMKNALYKNPMDKKSYNEAQKTIESTRPELAKWKDDANAYYRAVLVRYSTPATELSPEPAVVPQLHASVPSDVMFEDLKPAGAYLIQLFADALKHGSDTSMAAWLEDNLGSEEAGGYSFEECMRGFNETLHNYNQAYNTEEIGMIIDHAMAKAKAGEFSELSEYTGGSLQRTFDYYVNASIGNDEAIIGVHLDIVLNEDTKYYYLSSVRFD